MELHRCLCGAVTTEYTETRFARLGWRLPKDNSLRTFHRCSFTRLSWSREAKTVFGASAIFVNRFPCRRRRFVSSVVNIFHRILQRAVNIISSETPHLLISQQRKQRPACDFFFCFRCWEAWRLGRCPEITLHYPTGGYISAIQAMPAALNTEIILEFCFAHTNGRTSQPARDCCRFARNTFSMTISMSP